MADPLTPTTSGLGKAGLAEAAAVAGDEFMHEGAAFSEAQRSFELATLKWFGAIGACNEADFTIDEIMEIAHGVLKRAGASDAEIEQMEQTLSSELFRLKSSENTSKLRERTAVL